MNLTTLFNPATSAKAFAGGLTALIVSEVARFGFHPGAQSISAINVIVTGLVSYLIAHLAVWWTSNKPKTVV